MRILVLEQEPDAPAQLLTDWGLERGHELEVAAVPALERWPDAHEFDALVSLGSEASVHASPHAWIDREVAFLRDAHATRVPILGICFGAQALASALGATVSRADRVEVRWAPIDSDAPELIPVGPWFRWHFDRFNAPPGSRVIAGERDAVDAFTLERTVGVQFHPEVDAALAERWVKDGRGELIANGVDLEALGEQIARYAPGATGRAFDLFDRIERWWRR